MSVLMNPDASAVPTVAFHDLLTQARSGSREALGKLFEHLRRVLLHRAVRSVAADLRPKGAPSDLVQETLLEAHRDFASFRGTSEQELLAWLCQILLHNTANFRRRFRSCAKREVAREVPLEMIGSTPGRAVRNSPALARPPMELVIQTEETHLLEKAVNELPLVYREVFQLHYLRGRSFADIGGTLHCSAEAVRKLWDRAVKKLAWKLKAGT